MHAYTTGAARSQQETGPVAMMAASRPPRLPREARRLSGRPTCRIYPMNGIWVLELEPSSGAWLEERMLRQACGGDGDAGLRFPTLAAAIAYAECHGLDYRVVIPPRRRGGSPQPVSAD